MKKISCLVLAAAVTAAISGCEAPPQVRNPGPERWQQARAQRSDPYPQNYPGLPSVAGTRPMEYQDPRSEVLGVQPRKGEPTYGPCVSGAGSTGAQPLTQP
jgi:hypothetical protein